VVALSVRLVHFFGPDGSGKSTQVKLLTQYYASKGVEVRKFWLRSPHTIAYVLWQLAIKIGFYRCTQNEFGTQVKLPAVQNSYVLRHVWAFIEFIGIIPLLMLSKFYLARGYVLVAERHILDTIATVGYFVDDAGFAKSFFAKITVTFLPAETAFIYVDADYPTIRARRAKYYNTTRTEQKRLFKNDEPPAPNLEPKCFIDFQRKMYEKLAIKYNALVIDTSKVSVEETFSQIKKYLSN
jgi:thymidylate kinase